jgi:hypothetical protein
MHGCAGYSAASVGAIGACSFSAAVAGSSTVTGAGFRAPQLELPLSVAALPPVADSCDLPVHDLAIMLSLSVAALPPVADSCDLPVHDLAIMLPLSVAALPPVADACDLPVHDLALVVPLSIAAFPPVEAPRDLTVNRIWAATRVT